MAKQGGTVRRKRTARGTFYSIQFEARGQRWTHRLGGSWDGWTEERVNDEREHLARMIERGEYVRPEIKAPASASRATSPTLAVIATDFLARHRVRLQADKSVADLEWRLRHLIDFFGDVPVDTLTLKVRRKPRSFLELYQADALLRACRQLEQQHRGLTWEKVRLIRSSDVSNVALARELREGHRRDASGGVRDAVRTAPCRS